MNDYVTCDKCGAKLREKDGPIFGWRGVLCQSCWNNENFEDDSPPKSCIARGGPYPDCKSSCKLYDE